MRSTAGRLRVLRLDEVEPADLDRWRELAGVALEPNPFLEPEFLATVAHAWPESEDLRLAVIEDASRWRAVLAFTSAGGHGAALSRSRALTCQGPFLHDATGRQHPLVDADGAVGWLSTLLHGLRREHGAGILDLGFFPGEGELYEALVAAVRGQRMILEERQRDACAYALPLSEPEDASTAEDDFIRAPYLSARRRKALARAQERVVEAANAPVRRVDRSNDPNAVAEFIALQASGWKGDVESGGAAIATRPGYPAAFAQMASLFRDEGRWRLDALMAGDTTVHMDTAIRARSGGWFAVLDALNEEFHAFGAGHLGRVGAVSALRNAAPLDSYDPCMGAHAADQFSLYPHRRDVAYEVINLAPVPKATAAAVPGLRRVVNAVRPKGAS